MIKAERLTASLMGMLSKVMTQSKCKLLIWTVTLKAKLLPENSDLVPIDLLAKKYLGFPLPPSRKKMVRERLRKNELPSLCIYRDMNTSNV